jgi:CubicO group peptidase (beta-lactamase class C family)
MRNCSKLTFQGTIYSHSAGTQSENPDSPLFDKPISPDNSIWIASATKLMTSISILQLLENGLVDLDADVSSVLPELADPEVFLKFNDAGEPTYEKAIKKITIRMLLTHQSGVGYDFFQPYIQQIRDFKEKAGESVPSKLTWVRCINPLPPFHSS